MSMIVKLFQGLIHVIQRTKTKAYKEAVFTCDFVAFDDARCLDNHPFDNSKFTGKRINTDHRHDGVSELFQVDVDGISGDLPSFFQAS